MFDIDTQNGAESQSEIYATHIVHAVGSMLMSSILPRPHRPPFRTPAWPAKIACDDAISTQNGWLLRG